MKTLKTLFSPDKAASLILYFSILTFIIAFNFSDNPTSGWYQQFLPDLHGGSIVDLTFTDSLTGYAVTSVDDSSISYILKTSNAVLFFEQTTCSLKGKLSKQLKLIFSFVLILF